MFIKYFTDYFTDFNEDWQESRLTHSNFAYS
jgi:hypothetical protein